MEHQTEVANYDEQQGRRQCYICGADLDEYNTKETHHMRLRGMGGSPSLDVDENKVDICDSCHKAIHGPSVTLNIRREDGKLWVYRKINDEWVRQVPYGRLLKGEDVAKDLFSSESIVSYIHNKMNDFQDWNDEALKEQYNIFQDAGTTLFATECLIIHILSERRAMSSPSRDTKMGIKGAAEFLGISYQTARTRHAIWKAIFSQIGPGDMWHGLSSDFYYKAYNWKGKGIDPLEALDYAEAKALSNREYSPTRFQHDLEAGLPDGDTGQPTIQGCPYQCIHYRVADDDAELVLYEGPVKVARGLGEGQKYCVKKGLLIADLNTGEPCEYFELRR